MGNYFILFAFFISLAIFLAVSKRSISFAMFLAAIILGLFTVDFYTVWRDFLKSFFDARTLSIAIATAMIPIIGGVMNHTGLMDDLVEGIGLSRRYFVGVAPALFGMLPMPGGALLSAPVVDKVGGEAPEDVKATANVWFRHIFVLVYPMSSALIISTEVAGVPMYEAIKSLILYSLLSIAVGYVFYLREIPGESIGGFKFKIFRPLSILLVAPIVDFLIRYFGYPQLKLHSTLIGVSTSFILLLFIAKPNFTTIRKVFKVMKPWELFFLIIFIKFYLNVFLDSELSDLIASLTFNPIIFYIVIPFALGFFTGRVLTPASILYPIYVAKLGALTIALFSATYVSIFMGYIISPVHPCLILTADYFKIDVKRVTLKGVPAALIVTIFATILLLIST